MTKEMAQDVANQIYSEGIRFEFRPRHQMSRFKSFVYFLGSTRKTKLKSTRLPFYFL
jgi:hypothetical protein